MYFNPGRILKVNCTSLSEIFSRSRVTGSRFIRFPGDCVRLMGPNSVGPNSVRSLAQSTNAIPLCDDVAHSA